MIINKFLYTTDKGSGGGDAEDRPDKLIINDDIEVNKEDSNVVEDQKEIEDPTESLKKQIENLTYQNEKMKSDYRNVDSQRNRTENALKKFAKAIKEHGLADFDDDMNLIIHKQKQEIQEKKDEIEIVKDELKTTKQKFKDGDITEEDYLEKLSDLKATEKTLKLKQELIEEKIKEQKELERKTIETQTQKTTQNYADKLNNDFKGHGEVGNPLFNQMKKLFEEDPELYGDPNNNQKDRYVLAKMAKQIVDKQTKSEEKGTPKKDITDVKFKTPQSGKYDESAGKKGITDEDRKIIVEAGFNTKDIARLEKSGFMAKLKDFNKLDKGDGFSIVLG